MLDISRAFTAQGGPGYDDWDAALIQRRSERICETL